MDSSDVPVNDAHPLSGLYCATISGVRMTSRHQMGVTNSSNERDTKRKCRRVAGSWISSKMVNRISGGICLPVPGTGAGGEAREVVIGSIVVFE